MLERSHHPAGPAWPRLDPAAAAAIRHRAEAVDRGARDLGADLETLRDCGLMTAPLPVRDGGCAFGTDPGSVDALFEALRAAGHANLSLARVFEGHVNAAVLVAVFGSSRQRQEVAHAVHAGACLGVWGADGTPPVSVAGDLLRGRKRFASGLGLVSPAVVVATTEDGPLLALAAADDPARADASVWRVGGMKATASGTYDFDGVALTPLGRVGDYHREPWFEGGTWRYCAAQLGGAEALHDEMLGLLDRMGRAADPHQAHRIARSAIALETARMWIRAAAHRVTGRVDHAEAAASYALLAREATEAACLDVIHIVEKALGTMAHSTELAVERMRRDLGLYLRQANPDGKLTRAAAMLVRGTGRAEDL